MSRTVPRYFALPAAALLFLGALAGCSPATAPAPDDEPASTDTMSAEPQDPQSDHQSEDEGETEDEKDQTPSSEEDTSADNKDDWTYQSTYSPGTSSSEPAIFTGLRSGEHDGYDRIVIDFTGSGPLGWHANYASMATSQGKGDVIDVPGATFLVIGITGVSIPISDSDYAVYESGGRSANAGVVSAVYDSTFEGQAQVVIGMDAQRPFRIFTMEDPLRVVVDIDNS